ncbi:MAG: hypothetical protein AAF763_06235 [Pseudomonadota bacterium]
MKRSLMAALIVVPGMAFAGSTTMTDVSDSVTDAKDYDGADIRPTAELGEIDADAPAVTFGEPREADEASASVRDTQPAGGEIDVTIGEPQEADEASAKVRDTQPLDGETDVTIGEPQEADEASAKVRDDS